MELRKRVFVTTFRVFDAAGVEVGFAIKKFMHQRTSVRSALQQKFLTGMFTAGATRATMDTTVDGRPMPSTDHFEFRPDGRGGFYASYVLPSDVKPV